MADLTRETDMEQRTCAGCDGPLPPQPRPRNPRRWCSEACRVAAYYSKKRASGEWSGYAPRSVVFFRDCEECGRFYCARRSYGFTCSRLCQMARQARLQREQYRADPEAARAQARAERAVASIEARMRHRARNQARRALVTGAAVEVFSPLDVYERDAWTCGLCGAAILPELRFPDPGSVSLDHIVPLSKGGLHSLENSRAAHLHCNSSRGNRDEYSGGDPYGWSGSGSEAS